jgi:hypothetical protein
MRKYLVVIILLISVSIVEAQEVQEKDALDAISQAEKDMQEMQEMGFGVVYVNDTLIEAKRALEDKDYALVLEKAGAIGERKERAYIISDSLRALELRIEEVGKMGLNTTEAEENLIEASITFQNENYDEAEEAIFQGNKNLYAVEAEYTLLKARYNAARDNIISYLQRHRQDISIAAILLLVIGLVSYNKIRTVMLKRRLRDLELEKEVLVDLMKKAQIDYFQTGAISKGAYDIKMGKYNEMMLKVKETIPLLQARLK